MAGIVAIMGRPNVGKSTLFNRLVGARDALVDPMAGLTRDLRERECMLGDVKVSFIDTAGLDEEKDQSNITAQMTKQALTATEQADLVLFVVDGRSGLLPADEMWAQFLRKKASKIVLVANKCESREKTTSGQLDALRLGLGDALPISAEHNMGMGELEEEILATLAEVKKENPVSEPEEVDADADADADADGDAPRPMKLAIIGRPNAGKSSLVNHLLGTKRQLTDAEAGTTRDSIALDWSWQGKAIKLYDTAGLRRRTRIILRAEKLSVSSALQAIRFSDVVVLLLDAQKPFETQDLRLAELIVREGRGLVLAVNKIDLTPGVSMEDLSRAAEHYLPQMRGVPLAAFSVKTGKGTDRLMPKVEKAHTLWHKEIKTAPLNAWLQACVTRRPPPSAGGRAVRVKYITQKSNRPPSFILFTSRQKKLPDDYIRYLANDMRRSFNFEGTPVRIEVRASVNPYV